MSWLQDGQLNLLILISCMGSIYLRHSYKDTIDDRIAGWCGIACFPVGLSLALLFHSARAAEAGFAPAAAEMIFLGRSLASLTEEDRRVIQAKRLALLKKWLNW